MAMVRSASLRQRSSALTLALALVAFVLTVVVGADARVANGSEVSSAGSGGRWTLEVGLLNHGTVTWDPGNGRCVSRTSKQCEPKKYPAGRTTIKFKAKLGHVDGDGVSCPENPGGKCYWIRWVNTDCKPNPEYAKTSTCEVPFRGKADKKYGIGVIFENG